MPSTGPAGSNGSNGSNTSSMLEGAGFPDGEAHERPRSRRQSTKSTTAAMPTGTSRRAADSPATSRRSIGSTPPASMRRGPVLTAVAPPVDPFAEDPFADDADSSVPAIGVAVVDP